MANADDDPMAFLTAQRSKLAAMAHAAEEQAVVAATVAGVRNRMHAIEALASEPPSSEAPVVFEEMGVDAWKRKIAALSAPVTTETLGTFTAPRTSSRPIEQARPGSTAALMHSNASSHQEHAGYSGCFGDSSAPACKLQTSQARSYRQPAPASQEKSASTEEFCAQLGLCTKCFDVPCCCR